MIFDLADADSSAMAGTGPIVTDVLIIGAGIAGLLLAAKLRDQKIRVVVLESGGRDQTEDEHPLNRIVHLGSIYRGAMHGRFRCLGGTSTRWGGALIPFLPQDLVARPHLGIPAWPLPMSELEPHVAEIEKLFGLDDGPYDEAFDAGRDVPRADPDLLPRFAKWPTFSNRNVATLLKSRLERDAGFKVWINATATAFRLDEASGKLNGVTASHSSGRALTFEAQEVVVCAGAIESTRLLLILDRQSGSRVFRDCAALGRYFHDHVSMAVADLEAIDARGLNRLAGFRFVGKTMRSLRFELSPRAQAREGSGSVFGHISFAPEGKSGFDAIREVLRSLQRSGRIDRNATIGLLRDLPYLARAAYWRFVHRQLLWPQPARYELHAVVEQLPLATNRIALTSECDGLGCPLASIDWRIADAEYHAMRSFSRRFDAYWERHGLGRIARLRWRMELAGGSAAQSDGGGDVYHPGGTTRMGCDRTSAVVDHNLRTFAVPNLWVASTSTFPSGASANPTMMLMLFTMRLAKLLGSRLGPS
jgi:choline dehydrogenase-like flavoprotein